MRTPDARSWADYLVYGLLDHTERTFWEGETRQPTSWEGMAHEIASETCFVDKRPEEEVKAEFLYLARKAVRDAIPTDRKWGILLSGGVDSSILCKLVDEIDPTVPAYSFGTATKYDETEIVSRIVGQHTWVPAMLRPFHVRHYAGLISEVEDAPYGGIPSIALYLCMEDAKAEGVEVLLDGNGLDEQWGGYSYYAQGGGIIQATAESPTRPECLTPAFRALAEDIPPAHGLLAMQIRDITRTKFPRCIRYNTKTSELAGVELRSPFMNLDMIKLALRQPDDRKIRGGVHKYLEREMARDLGLPPEITEPAKRAVQTPQREWLRDELHDWAEKWITRAVEHHPDWLDAEAVYREWDAFSNGKFDNSFFVWQWISLGLMS